MSKLEYIVAIRGEILPSDDKYDLTKEYLNDLRDFRNDLFEVISCSNSSDFRYERHTPFIHAHAICDNQENSNEVSIDIIQKIYSRYQYDYIHVSISVCTGKAHVGDVTCLNETKQIAIGEPTEQAKQILAKIVSIDSQKNIVIGFKKSLANDFENIEVSDDFAYLK